VSNAMLRPGIAQGFYPERSEPPESWLDRAAHRLHGSALRLAPIFHNRQRDFLVAVHEHTRLLEGVSDDELTQQVAHLRHALIREGLTDEVIAPTFAAIRETSLRASGVAHYDVQLLAGRAMAHGSLAEMETGEGKTLSATLPAATVALAGVPVHVISVNDYLVQRDAEAMRPIYHALGLTVGIVTERMSDRAERQAAYACDVTYVTGKQVAFDYLKDGLQRRHRRSRLTPHLARLRGEPAGERLLLRGLCFAVVDEADSVLVDEARTPLILSGPAGSGDWDATYRQAMEIASTLEEGSDFRLHIRKQAIEFTESGRRRLEELAAPLEGMWTGPNRREEWVEKALRAVHFFLPDRHYLVRRGKIEIIDQPTGRAAPDRAWERGLHQMIEIKEGCELSPERETLARISYQQFFRRYLRLSGMTGTAREVASELWSVYRLNPVLIPTRLPVQRRSSGSRLFATADAKWDAVAERARELQRIGQPVLVGTCSVEASEHLGALLAERGLPHRVLNARQDGEEASIVAEAGRRGRITLATNMAGRGTDIQLGAGVLESGGLHVIATQRSEARRIDRQLFGRCGRQGDPGSYEEIFSLEDDPLQAFFPVGIRRILVERWVAKAPLFAWQAKLLTRLPQWAEERRHARTRRSLMAMEEYLERLLAFSGPGE
jgi:preprotein translocase subunit SecA